MITVDPVNVITPSLFVTKVICIKQEYSENKNSHRTWQIGVHLIEKKKEEREREREPATKNLVRWYVSRMGR